MRTLRLSLTAIIVLVGLSLLAPAPRAEETTTSGVSTGTFKYLLYYNGARVGWAKSKVKLIDYDGRKVIHESETGYVEIRRSFDNQVFKSNSRAEYWYELDGRAIRETETLENGGQTRKTEVVYGSDSTTIKETVDDSEPVETTVEYGDKTVYSDYRAWRILKEEDRIKPGEKFEFWGVEESEHALVKRTWTVNGKVKRKLSDDEVVEGIELQVIEGGKAVKVVFGEDDWPLLVETAMGFSVERTSEIPDPFKAERVTLRNTMKANVAIEDVHELETLDIHFEYEHDDGNGVPPICETNTYHDVIKYEDGYAVRMKAQKLDDDFELAYPIEEIPDDIKPYLEPTAMCQSDNEDIKEWAEKLSRRKKDARLVAAKIMRWTNRHLQDGSGDTGSASAVQAFKEKKGDCTEHAALFVATARAAGLPARNVSGIVYATSPDGSFAIFGYHQWAEVWLGEWVPVDATVDELGTSPRYIQFEYDEPGHTHGAGRSGRCIKQDINPIIDAYTRENGKKWSRHGAPEFEWEE